MPKGTAKSQIRAYFAATPPKARAALKKNCSLFPMTGAIRRKLAADLEG